MKLELSYIQNTQQRKAWPQTGRERVHLLWFIVVTAPVFHFDTSWLNADAKTNTAREGATKEKKDQPTTIKKGPFQTHKNKSTKRVRIVIRWNSSCRFFKIHYNGLQRKAWAQRGRVHLLWYIVVTAPVFQLDTSWLNTDANRNTARQQNGIVSKTQNKITKRVRSVTRWNLIVVYSNTQQRKAWPQRGRERVHLLCSIFITAPVFHFDTSWLNLDAS